MDKKKLLEDSFGSIYGQEMTKREIKSALLMNRHLIIVGPPGVGKTTIAKNIANLLPEIEVNDCLYNCSPDNPVCPACKSNPDIKTKMVSGDRRFIRLQGSPDLVVEDILGDIDPIKALKFGPLSIEAFTPGKIFKANNGILFFDELNRCPEKLQNALLQVLEEGKATIGSYDVDIDASFIFIGTMNPLDFAGTEKLSEVLLDRFDMVYMTYPESLDIEKEIVRKKGKKLEVKFTDEYLELALSFIRELRDNDQLERVPSVRASLGLYERSQANAYIKNKTSVDIDDIFDSMISVLVHRIKLKPSAQYLQKPSDFIRNALDEFLKKKDFDYTRHSEQNTSDSGTSDEEGDLP